MDTETFDAIIIAIVISGAIIFVGSCYLNSFFSKILRKRNRDRRLTVINLNDNTILFDIRGNYKLTRHKNIIKIKYKYPEHEEQTYIIALANNAAIIETTNVDECCVMPNEQINS